MKNTEFTLSGDPPISISVRRSNRTRTLRLKVSRLGGIVEVAVPSGIGIDQARRFAADNRQWIMTAVKRSQERIIPRFGSRFPLEGNELLLRRSNGAVPRCDGQHLNLQCDESELPAVLGVHCKWLARSKLDASVRHHAELLAIPTPRFRIKDTTSRWGSCSARGNLNFSWRLIMMPPVVLNYVVAHEVSHLAEMNHSPMFWKIVERLCPRYREHRKWLKDNGSVYLGFQLL